MRSDDELGMVEEANMQLDVLGNGSLQANSA